jgi:hypothetical protein
MTLDELLTKMNGAALVIDPVTDTTDTATRIEVKPLHLVEAAQADPLGAHTDGPSPALAADLATVVITDPALIRALYDHPTAEAYGDGSYTVTTPITPERAALYEVHAGARNALYYVQEAHDVDLDRTYFCRREAAVVTAQETSRARYGDWDVCDVRDHGAVVVSYHGGNRAE